MYIMGSWVIGQIDELLAPEVKYSVFRPIFHYGLKESKVSGSVDFSLSVPKKSKHLKEALKLVEFMTSPEMNAQWKENIPAQPAVANQVLTDPHIRAFADDMIYSTFVFDQQIPAEVDLRINTGIQGLLDKVITAQELAEEVETVAKKYR